MTAVRWLAEPEDHDYAAALDYLELLAVVPIAQAAVAALRHADTVTRKSKDLLRATGLPPLEATNRHVARDLHKIHGNIALSPVLLIRGDARHGSPLTIADGYHRVCAVHAFDEDAPVACRIADLS